MIALQIAMAIEELAPRELQESWDNSGFSVGSPYWDVSGALLALDCTPEVVDEAISAGFRMIITHHPLIFKGLKQITGRTVQERMIEKLIKNEMIVYSAHTNIDKVFNGVSGYMADKLGLINREILDYSNEGENGLGMIGDMQKEMSPNDFLFFVKEKFGIKCLRSSKPVEKMIKRVAVCGGSGSSLIAKAYEKGATAYVTGDISYHHFFCENDFMVVDTGHFESESGALEIIASLLRKKIPTFAVRKSEGNNNPIYYY